MTNASHFAIKFIERIVNLSEPYDEVRIIFDQYLGGSLKEVTRVKRVSSITSVHFHVNDHTEIKNIKCLLSHIRTKSELTTYLSKKVLAHFKNHSKRVIVTHQAFIESNQPLSDLVTLPGMAERRHNLEEGDQLVLLNAVDVQCKDASITLDIFSVDTDVYILLIGNFTRIPKSTTLIRKMSERIRIEEDYLKLGPQRAEALIGWYAFRGTDNTGAFFGKGVTQHFQLFLRCDNDILSAFSAFGTDLDVGSSVYEQMERYVSKLYIPSGHRPTLSSSVAEVRWMLFSQKNRDCKNLPPTLGTLKPHVMRAYYMALIWKRSIVPIATMPIPLKYGWTKFHGELKPVMYVQSPAPDVLLELKSCNCKTGCKSRLCSCIKSGMVCSELCGCGDICQNAPSEEPLEV